MLTFLTGADQEFAEVVHQALIQEFGDDYGTGPASLEAWQAVMAGQELAGEDSSR